jgi:hypothetical protein
VGEGAACRESKHNLLIRFNRLGGLFRSVEANSNGPVGKQFDRASASLLRRANCPRNVGLSEASGGTAHCGLAAATAGTMGRSFSPVAGSMPCCSSMCSGQRQEREPLR